MEMLVPFFKALLKHFFKVKFKTTYINTAAALIKALICLVFKDPSHHVLITKSRKRLNNEISHVFV